MPLALIVIAALLIISAVRGTYQDLGSMLAADFTGGGAGFKGSFLAWIAAIGSIGALGTIPALRTPSHLLLGLILLVLFISQQGFFAQFAAALQQPLQPQQAVAEQPLPPAIPLLQVGGAGGSSSGGGGPLGALSQGLSIGKTLGGLFGG
jgi:hypothetical protein